MSRRRRSQSGVPTEVAFFGRATAERLAARGVSADLIAANNVLAHVPDIRDFVAGFAVLLAPEGVATFEFPHLLNLIRDVQFDTIYHEHFSYLSLTAVEAVFAATGLHRVRRRGAADPWRLAAPLRLPRRRRPSRDRAARRPARQGARRRPRPARRLSRLRAAGRGGQTRLPRLPRRGARRGQARRRLWRGGQGQHLPQRLRRRRGRRRLRLRPQPGQAGPAAARQPYPDPARRSGSPRCGPIICVVLPWNLIDEIRAQTAANRRLGRPLGRRAAATRVIAP